jgi:hypothetical protein
VGHVCAAALCCCACLPGSNGAAFVCCMLLCVSMRCVLPCCCCCCCYCCASGGSLIPHEYAPGVYLSLQPLPAGGLDLKRVRFSKQVGRKADGQATLLTTLAQLLKLCLWVNGDCWCGEVLLGEGWCPACSCLAGVRQCCSVGGDEHCSCPHWLHSTAAGIGVAGGGAEHCSTRQAGSAHCCSG